MEYCSKSNLPNDKISGVKKIAVIGDIHGDRKALIKCLKLAGVVDKNLNWNGGKTHVVQLGDILDRKSRSSYNKSDELSEKWIIDKLLDLKHQAQNSGGDVHIIIGNHELMNFEGDFRYVSSYGMQDFNYRKEILAGKKYAKLLACNSVGILKINNWIFSHAGIVPHVNKNISKINEEVRNFMLGLSDFSEELRYFLWHRDYSGNNVKCNQLLKIINKYGATHAAVGHNVQHNGINSVCDGHIWRTDVGMSGAFKLNQPQILVIENGIAKVVR